MQSRYLAVHQNRNHGLPRDLAGGRNENGFPKSNREINTQEEKEKEMKKGSNQTSYQLKSVMFPIPHYIRWLQQIHITVSISVEDENRAMCSGIIILHPWSLQTHSPGFHTHNPLCSSDSVCKHWVMKSEAWKASHLSGDGGLFLFYFFWGGGLNSRMKNNKDKSDSSFS